LCGKNPNKYRVIAFLENINGLKKRVPIRYDQDGNRLEDVIDVLTTLKRIKQELAEGSFDVRKYDSKSARESFIFKNFSKKYLEYCAGKLKRKELTPSSLRRKKGLIDKYLTPYFSNISIDKITSPMIKQFKNGFIDKLRTRDLALSELKTMLNHALEYGLIQKLPVFEKIPKSKRRKNILTIEEALEIISFVDNNIYKACFSLMSIYPIRPSEVRALKWKDIDFKKNTITIQRHVSDNHIIEGRKSLSVEHDKSSITYPLTSESIIILNSVPRSINEDVLIFLGKQGGVISQNTLPRAWRKACANAKKEYVQPYEIKHARLSEIAEHTKGDIVKMMAASGHTNANVLLDRYIRNRTDLKEIFQ
jgi:integrase